jgi:enoyl-CoA hydratase/carnithine racemase
MTKTLKVADDPATTDDAWGQVSDGTIGGPAARQIATWYAQASHGHAGTFAALAAGRPVPAAELRDAIASEYDEASEREQAALSALRAWSGKQ